MIHAVTFDFWNTLYEEDAHAQRRRRDRRVAVAQSFFAAAGKVVESAAVRKALETAIARLSALRTREQRGASRGEIGSMIAAELGFRMDEADAMVLAESLSGVGREHPPTPIEGAGSLLAALRGKVRLGLISDTGMTLGTHLAEIMDVHGLGEFFEHRTWSDETLTTKPQARQFLHTLFMLDVPPSEAVHVGDLEAADIAGAKAVGMRAVRVGGSNERTVGDAAVDSLGEVAAVLRRWGVAV